MSYGNEEESKVYVGSMDFNTSEEELRAAFEQYGPVDDGKKTAAIIYIVVIPRRSFYF